MFYIRNVLLIFMLAGIKASDHVPHRLFLSVYYESRCPDSRNFILRQLKPTMDLLSKHIMLRLVPFGKAKSYDNGYGGFECQHGPSECLGNMVQSCTLDLMQGRSDVEKVNYIACEMKRYAASNGDFSCVEKANISPKRINACIASGRGTQLQLDAEFHTKLIHPKFIPTITIDGIITIDRFLARLVAGRLVVRQPVPQSMNEVMMRNQIFNQQTQDQAQVDLTGTLCAILKDTKDCARHYNNMALQYILI